MRQVLLLHLLFMALMSAVGFIRVRYYRRQHRMLGLSFANQGRTMNEIRQLAAMVALLVMVVHTINPRVLSWTEVTLPYAVRWIGAGFAVLAVLLLAKAADAALEGATADEPLPFRTEGLYALVRHPLYAMIAFTAGALTVLSANWIVGLIGGAMAAHALLVRARRDEEQLKFAHGAAYDRYALRTPKFFPHVGRRALPVGVTPGER